LVDGGLVLVQTKQSFYLLSQALFIQHGCLFQLRV